ncbi:hypothetical protein [Nocardia neocaledoniensis]|uniref:hypothetical protein n=1 Tax=Nocardia neocaledoniensis TaxID=236511 RepID=UPI002456B4CF|nr:hypothetical protein [Nocardia neocaledoniensis]
MKGIEATKLRNGGWGDAVAAAAADEEAFAITVRGGSPEAVLLSAASWRYGRSKPDAPAVSEDDIERQTSAKILRQLAGYRAAARSGKHILITKYEGLSTSAKTADSAGDEHVVAVLAPYRWVRTALSELGDVADD